MDPTKEGLLLCAPFSDLCVFIFKRQLSPDSVRLNSIQTAFLVPFGSSTFYDALNQTDVTHKYSFDDNP